VSSSSAIWPSIVALITAIITAFIAYLNYRTRAQLLATKEKHTEQLQSILSKWNQSFSPGFRPDFVTKKHVQIWSSNNPTLFEDLREHQPKELEIFKEWDEYKNTAQQCNSGMDELISDISQYVDNKIANPLFTGVEITSSYSALIYEYTILVSQNDFPAWTNSKFEYHEHNMPEGSWSTCQIGMYIIIKKGKKENVERAADFFSIMIASLSNKDSSEYKRFVVKAIHLNEMAAVLEQRRIKLYQDIEEMRAIPILPGDCKHIKRALDPLFSNFKFKRSK
jgi:hypothetical protein